MADIFESFTHCCGSKLNVMESRIHIIGGTQTVWRRKKCKSCGAKVTTLELCESIGLEVLEED